jgi:hypothetical protein
MKPAHRAAASLLTAAVGLTVAACGPTVAPASQPPGSSSRSSTRPSAPPHQTNPTATTRGNNQEDQMRIEITIGDQHFQATLDDSAASGDLVAQLPVTVEMDDHGSVEKTGSLPSPLSLDGQPAGADPNVGDVGYYAPGNDLVLYYGDMSYYNGIVVLGRLDGDAAERIAHMEGSITAAVASLDD